MTQATRRVVTAQEREKGGIVSDAMVAPIDLGGGVAKVELWRAGEGGKPAPLEPPWPIDPPPFGHVFLIAEFPPTASGDEPWMHMTSTIDYGIVLDGELTLVTESGDTVLRAGDVVVQQGANHGWINRSATPCRLAVVLIDATVRAK